MSSPSSYKDLIRNQALNLGFDAVGFSKAEKLDHLEEPLNTWIHKGYHGTMSWMEKNVEMRLDPTLLFPGAMTVISLVSWYYSDQYEPGCGISRYAVGRDYHKVLKKQGEKLIRYVRDLAGDVQARVFVDSAPLLEKEWAKKSGLGWVGKNGCLIQVSKGSWFFLSEIVLDLELEPDSPIQKDFCGSCNLCVEACPTGALLGNGWIDARKCISYLTIELKGDFENQTDTKWKDWIFGCDICQDVCPWNRNPLSLKFQDLQPRGRIMSVKQKLSDDPDPDEINHLIAGTPLRRTGGKGLIRNYIYTHPPLGQKDRTDEAKDSFSE